MGLRRHSGIREDGGQLGENIKINSIAYEITIQRNIAVIQSR